GEPAEVAAVPALVVAVAGLAANLVAFWLLRPGAAESINVEGAYLEVLADLAGSVVVIVSAAVVAATGFTWVDAVAGGLLGVWILPRTFSLGRRALRVLLQAAPPEIPLEQLTADLSALPGVVDVHDVHVWTLTSDMEVATAHVMVAPGTDTHAVLDQARVLLRDRYGIAHATVQVEPEDHRGCDEITW
ncbi:MAG: cation transporter, partial [Acidimicrobiia bacterium]